MRSLKYLIPPVVALIILASFEVFFTGPAAATPGELVLIRPQTTANQVAQTLSGRGIIKSSRRFLFFARIFGFDKRIQPGRYYLPAGRNELEVLKIITSLRYSKGRVTIPEGLTTNEIASILESNGVCSAADFLNYTTHFKLPAVAQSSIEGFLFPDTYDLPVGLGPKKTVDIMVNRFYTVFDELKKELGVDSVPIAETVVLASLIEKEAKLNEERPVIASVFINRLKKSIRLECCATVEYILPEHKPTLTYADLKTPSRYNTYLHPGLPPGPICNPGRASLRAALKPALTDYFYFVAQGDGSHKFSKTLADHIQAKNRNTNISNDSK